MKKIAVIVNGKKRFSSRINRMIELLKMEHTVQVMTTEYSGHAVDLAIDACGAANLLVAAGGDGTLNEVVNGICASGKSTTLSVYPCGNGNDFATAMGIGKHPEKFVAMIRKNYVREIDVGVVTNDEGKKFFINIASVGIGGYVAQKINEAGGVLKYPRLIVEGFFRMKKAEVVIRWGDSKVQALVLSAAFCNGTTFAHGLVIQPDARLDDGLLHSCVIGDVSVGEYVKNLRRLKKGRKLNHPKVGYSFGEKYTIELIDGECHIETDGEYFGMCPAVFEIEKEKISFLLPEEVAGS